MATLLSPALEAWRTAGRTHPYKGQPVFFRRDGAGAALLLLHGFPTASYDFHAIWDDLTARYDTIAADFIGFGFSAKPRQWPYSVFTQTDMIEDLLHGQGISSLHIIAHDFGDTIAQEMLARARERPEYPEIRSVFLMNGGMFYDCIRPLFTQRLLRSRIGALAQHLMTRRGFGRSFSSIFGPGTRPAEADLDDFWSLITMNGGKGVMHAIIQYLGERQRYQQRWTKALTHASVPLRFLYGPEDPVSGALIAERFRQIAPAADIVRVEGIGHYPQVEAPQAVLSSFLAFQGRIGLG